MKPKELRGKKDKELKAFMEKWGRELAVLQIQASVGQCPNSATIGHLKKDMARAKTILRERESAGQEVA